VKNTRHWKKSLVEKMTNFDELEELLRSGEDEEAYKQIKGDRCITAEILINEGIFFVSRLRKKLAVSYNNRGTTYYELKKQEKAIEDYNKAIVLNPEVEGLIDPERTIFNARISSFALVSEFIRSIRGIDDNTDLGKVKDKLAKLHNESKEVEILFESVNFDAGKTTIVNMQRIISSVKQEIGEIKWAANRKQTALDILIKYWSRVSESIQALNGILTRKTENIALERRIETMGSKMDDQFEETKEILTEEQIKEKAEEIIRKIKCVKEELQETVKREFLDVITRIPVIGAKLLKRLEKTTD